jgi:hypothetical protein
MPHHQLLIKPHQPLRLHPVALLVELFFLIKHVLKKARHITLELLNTGELLRMLKGKDKDAGESGVH